MRAARKRKFLSAYRIAILSRRFLLIAIGFLVVPGDAGSEIQNTRLQPSVPVTRDISGSETHEYRVALRAGQALHVVVQQLGVDLVVTVSAPDGAPIVEMDSPNGANGPESVWVIASAEGDHKILVRAFNAASSGRYELRVETLRDATAEDRSRVELQDALMAAGRLVARQDAEARLGALDNSKRAAAAARRLKDSAALSAVSTYLLNLDPEGTLQSSGLSSAAGDVPVYYSRGFEQRARDLRERLTAPMKFFESKLQVRPRLVVALLTRDDWTELTAFPPYGMPFSINTSLLAKPSARALLCMPATADPDVQAAGSAAAARASQAAGIPVERGMHLADEFVLYHELSHIYADAYGITSWNTVVREFMAAFLEVAYHAQVSFDTRDRLFYETWITPANWASGQKPKNTSLDDFERLLIGVDNYGWYQAQLWKRAETVYKAQGLAFLEGVKAAFPHGTPPLTVPETLARLEKISPGFIEWAERLSRPPNR